SLAIDPQNPATLYAGTNQGIRKLGPAGGSCENGLPYYFIGGLAIDPRTPDTVYTTVRGGLYKSTNGCGSWSPINSGLPRHTNPYDGSDLYSVSAPVIVPVTPATLYASTGGDGFFKSTDGGANWCPFMTQPNCAQG